MIISGFGQSLCTKKENATAESQTYKITISSFIKWHHHHHHSDGFETKQPERAKDTDGLLGRGRGRAHRKRNHSKEHVTIRERNKSRSWRVAPHGGPGLIVYCDISAARRDWLDLLTAGHKFRFSQFWINEVKKKENAWLSIQTNFKRTHKSFFVGFYPKSSTSIKISLNT